MKGPRGVAVVAVPLFAVLLFSAAMGSRKPPEAPATPRRTQKIRFTPSPAPHPRTAEPRPEAVPEAAMDLARTVDESRFVSTFQNYRAAVATGNAPLQRALLPILMRDRVAVLELARKDLELARTSPEIETARSVLQSFPK
jgi:hypothetical protein